MQNGLMHLYWGDGKGKTTAAIGLAVRAAGTGEKVIFAQFMKGGQTGELAVLQGIETIQVMRSDKEFPFYAQMTQEQKQELTAIHNKILDDILQKVTAGKYGMVVLDEITYPNEWGLLDCGKLRKLLKTAEGKIEVVCTGRNPASFLWDSADYITEMKAIRHPFEKGIGAREGIEY